MRFGIFFITVFLAKSVYCQNAGVIQGRVTDQSNKPVAGASIYLSNTSRGVTTSNIGEFKLSNLPDGKYDLVISAIGYETKVIAISSDNYHKDLNVKLNQQSTELTTVVVEPHDKNGWTRWGKYFIENFIGKTRNAKFCKLVNHESITFRFSEKNNKLTAKANEPLKIENPVLGYHITFQLIEFTADFNTGMVSYYGYPFFTEVILDSDKKRRNVKRNREQVYMGSLLHFMRALYNDALGDESFIVRVRDAASESETVPDVSVYTKQISRHSKSFFFDNTLEIIYAGASNRRADPSEIMLETPQPLEVMRNGSYFSPKELIIFKHWGETEKLSNMLPFDYYP